jgi:hypothetical protein
MKLMSDMIRDIIHAISSNGKITNFFLDISENSVGKDGGQVYFAQLSHSCSTIR